MKGKKKKIPFFATKGELEQAVREVIFEIVPSIDRRHAWIPKTKLNDLHVADSQWPQIFFELAKRLAIEISKDQEEGVVRVGDLNDVCWRQYLLARYSQDQLEPGGFFLTIQGDKFRELFKSCLKENHPKTDISEGYEAGGPLSNYGFNSLDLVEIIVDIERQVERSSFPGSKIIPIRVITPKSNFDDLAHFIAPFFVIDLEA